MGVTGVSAPNGAGVANGKVGGDNVGGEKVVVPSTSSGSGANGSSVNNSVTDNISAANPATPSTGTSATTESNGVDTVKASKAEGNPTTGKVTYQYDSVGNRLMQGSTLSGIDSKTYIYDANDRLTNEIYDANGNVIAVGDKIFSYDGSNRLTRVSGAKFNLAISYNEEGERVAKTVNGVTTQFLVAKDELGLSRVWAEVENGELSRRYTHGHQLICQEIAQNGKLEVYYYVYDGQGNVRFLTDGEGNITDRYDYDAFGNLIDSSGTTPNRYLFGGEEYDADLGLYYLRARYLNPRTGRFWTADQYEGQRFDPPSLHKYLYANADPINRIDPSGYSSIKQTVALAISAVLTTVSNLFLTDRVIAPTTDPIANNVSRANADLDDAQLTLLLLLGNVFTPLASGPSLAPRVALPTNPSVRRNYARSLRVLQQACFSAGTAVKMPFGTKPIEQIKTGDYLYSRNLHHGGLELKPVTATTHHLALTTLQLEVIDKEEVNKKEFSKKAFVKAWSATLQVTPEHLLYIRELGDPRTSWVAAEKVNIGDEWQQADGRWMTITKIAVITRAVEVFNLEVADNHNYFVGQSELLVHNGPCEKVYQIAERVAGKYKIGECVECYKKLMQDFKKAGIKGKVLEMRTVLADGKFNRGAFIANDDAIGRLADEQLGIDNGRTGGKISINGLHYAIEVDGIVFDNIYPKGIERAVWQERFLAKPVTDAQSPYGTVRNGAIVINEKQF
jgi:RHS repeat-associated protein